MPKVNQAVDIGKELARRAFATQGGPHKIHLSETELAAICTVAVEKGLACAETAQKRPRQPVAVYQSGEFNCSWEFVKTGEFREPNADEWFLSDALGSTQLAYYARQPIGTKFHILKRATKGSSNGQV